MKNTKKLLALLLIFAMLLPSVILPASAAEEGETGSEEVSFAFKNLLDDGLTSYDRYQKQDSDGTIKADNSKHYSYYYWHTNNISVEENETITFGPFPENFHDESVWVYATAGNASNKKYRIYSDCIEAEVTGKIFNNMVIYTYKVPAGVKAIRLVFPQDAVYQYDEDGNKVNRVLITKNYRFTADEYFAYMKQEKNLDVKFV
nr:hypothetical protein [Clostridia bacterium]